MLAISSVEAAEHTKERGRMTVYSYTKIQRREKRVYSLFNTTISQQGLSMGMIKCAGGALAVGTLLGLLFCAFTGTMWYNPVHFVENSNSGYFFIVFVGVPIAIGIALNSYKIQNYRAVDYLKLYLQPKQPLNQDGKRVKLVGFHVKGFVERL